MKNTSRWVYLDDYLPQGRKMHQITEYTDNNGIVMEIWPKAGMTDFVYQSLMSMSEKGFDVFLRKDIPQRWHYQKHRRIAPLLLVAKEGVAVLTEESLSLIHI